MPAPPSTGSASNPAAATIPTPQAGMALSARTVSWLAGHPNAQEVVCSVWTTLTELKRAGHQPGALDALRFVLIHHQPPTHTGRLPYLPYLPWHQLWRRRPFPCVVWRQIRGELLGHLAIASDQIPRHRARSRQTGD